jgi:putative endopeptidase
MTAIHRRRALSLSLAAVAAAASPSRAGETVPRISTGSWGFDLAGENPAIRPGDDFFAYANGGFIDGLEIPPDRSDYGIDYILAQQAELDVRALLESADDAPGPGAEDSCKARMLYRSFTDEAKVNALGARPLAPGLARIAAAGDAAELAVLTAPPGAMTAPLLQLGIQQDAKAPDRYAVHLGQAGLGLPDRDFYLQPSFAAKLQAYRSYVATMLRLVGWMDPESAGDAVAALETRFAKASWTRTDRRDPNKTYNPADVDALTATSPGFPWRRLLDAADLAGVERIVVEEPDAVSAIASIWLETPLPTLKAWAAFHHADVAAPYLSDVYSSARFAFRGTVLNGQPADRARWNRGIRLANNAMGEAVGRLYVAKRFPPEAKQQIGNLVDRLKTAMRARIERLDWMSAATKTQAMAKLDTLRVKLGYPDRWRDYGALEIRTEDLIGNVGRAQYFEWRRKVARLGGPVDRGEWEMTPQTVNAYYSPNLNEIVFPAAQLQPPYFDVGFDLAVNYGGIGGVIGHELTHAFDDTGRKFDAQGRLADWWAEGDGARFDARADVLGRQFDAYELFPGVHPNGKLTMGENIADLGGLLVAYDAYHAALGGEPAPIRDGLTGDQRFFLAFAQSWREKTREALARTRVVADPHAPEKFRTNGSVRNVDAWYAAFSVSRSDKLYLSPEARAQIW